MIKKYYVLYGNNSLMLEYDVSVEAGDLELKDVIRHIINIDSSELGRIQEFEREAEEKEKELEGKALELRKIIQELKGKEYELITCEDDSDYCFDDVS